MAGSPIDANHHANPCALAKHRHAADRYQSCERSARRDGGIAAQT